MCRPLSPVAVLRKCFDRIRLTGPGTYGICPGHGFRSYRHKFHRLCDHMTLLIVDLPTDMYCKKRSKILKSIHVLKKVHKEGSEAFYNLPNFTNIFFRNIAEVHVVECLLGGHVRNATLKGITTWLFLLFIAQCKLMINLLITVKPDVLLLTFL